jgi:sterol desaturase/sphingolipid hydroxylase (fatty acid hydroxylase superfamily)
MNWSFPILYVVTGALFVALFTREVIAPASGATCDKRWRILAGSVNAVAVGVAIVSGWVFAGWIDANSLFQLPTSFTPMGNGLLVFLVASFFAYWWHRLCHASDLLWRCVHQLHHSPKRVEALTAFFAHPMDSFLATMLNAAVAYLVLGATALEAAIALGLVSVFNLLAHTDSRTPYWLGWFLQRPEMHRYHHELDVHAGNYGLPFWDLLFGTWRNPKPGDGAPECGFADPAHSRIKDMLLMRDVCG